MPEKHFAYVWDNFISKAAAQSIVVVAHSYGGIVIVEGVNWIFNGRAALYLVQSILNIFTKNFSLFKLFCSL